MKTSIKIARLEKKIINLQKELGDILSDQPDEFKRYVEENQPVFNRGAMLDE